MTPPVISSVAGRPTRWDRLFETTLSTTDGNVLLMIHKRPSDPGKIPLSQALPLRILIAEDNEVNQRLLVHVLKQLGYEGHIVGNGKEALQELGRQHYDVVFMDVHMPEMDGLETTRQILQKWKDRERPTIIALTADTLPGDREKCIEAGMDDYLSKPVRVDQVREALERWGPQAIGKQSGGHDILPTKPEDLVDTIAQQFKHLGFYDDRQFLAEFIAVSLADLIKRRDQLVSAYRAMDLNSLHYAAHSLKGVTSNFGVRTIIDLCRAIEEKAGQGSLDGLESVMDSFLFESERVQAALQILAARFPANKG